MSWLRNLEMRIINKINYKNMIILKKKKGKKVDIQTYQNINTRIIKHDVND